ncbi:MAG: DUF115 domain-containing protein [Proteobacteria bacterium]|nr:DUF115 domain-containing protein [Pseudomonadota bacterium]
MSFNIINELRLVTPEQRGKIIQAMYEKNKKYFKENYPVINQFLERNTCPYRIDMTATYLNVVDIRTNELAHPTAGLDRFAEMLGGWTHNGWQELFNLRVIYPEKEGVHNKCIKGMFNQMDASFPEHKSIWNNGRLNLKELPDGRRFSPPIVFMGIFHGLHIAHLFNTTVFTDALFLEPEPDRFEVSLYFLDYQEIIGRLGSFHIYVGTDANARHFARFFNDYSVTQHMWVRVLPGYPSDKMPLFVEAIKALQATRSDTVFAHDDHVQGLRNGCKNLVRHLPLLSERPRLSGKSKIAVVASGPSLINDLGWLQKNKEKVLIFAVHSSVRTLKQHGIKPDLQFSLDTLLDKETVQKLDLFADVPLVNNYKVGESVVEAVDKIFLAGDKNASNAVKLVCPLQFTTPSSTNLAFSFACFCKPQEIYLLGCDMGFRSFEESHVPGHHNENNKSGQDVYRMASQMLTAPNFKENKPFQTTSFLNSTRMAIEASLAEAKALIKIFNFSDGARIDGAVARRSDQMKVPQYKRKGKDLEQLYSCFFTMQKNKNWNHFQTSGRDVLVSLKKHFLENIKLDHFDWGDFSRRINTALFAAMESCGQEMGKDYRMAIYNKVLLDLLCAWYIFIIFRDNLEEAELIYQEGYKNIKAILDELEWPEDVTPSE